MLNHKFRSKKALSDRVLIGLLCAPRSDCEKKYCANAENSRSHPIPPHPSSREHSDTTRQVSASSAKSLAPAYPAVNRWELATPPASERPRVRFPESFALLSNTS